MLSNTALQDDSSENKSAENNNQDIQSLSQRLLGHSTKWFNPVWMIFIVLAIFWGYENRDQDYLTAERGLGYWLGIIGGSMMLLLLIYSLRKRLKSLRRVLTVKFWFQFHMALGIIGPMCILYHSNFRLGSFNSSVALVCMLLVAGSGIAGRYLYTRIHFGLYGEKIRLQQVSRDFQVLQEDISLLAVTPKQKTTAEKLFKAIDGLIRSQAADAKVFTLFASRQRAGKISKALKDFVTHLDRYHRDNTNSEINVQHMHEKLQQESKLLLLVLSKLPGLQLFERLFSLWHVIHIPIFILMIITAVTHVVVVHMY